MWHRDETVILYLFPDEAVIRYGRKPPRRGSRVRSPRGRTWIVDEVLQSGRDTYTATVVAPRFDLPAARGLAADLLDRARDAVSPREIQRRRRERDYIP